MAVIVVQCPECGERLKLKSRASLGKKRPCPKCHVPFVLDEDTNRDSYDLDLDARGVSKPAAAADDQPVLKRGVSKSVGRAKKSGGGSSISLQNNPLLLGLGAGGLIGVGMLLAWLLVPRDPAPVPQPGAFPVTDNSAGQTQPVSMNGAAGSPEAPGGNPPTAPRKTTSPPRVGANQGSQSTRGKTVSSQPPRASSGAPGNSAGQSGTVDLLATVNPAQDSQRGNWSKEGLAVISSGNGILKLNLIPQDSYRASVRFMRESGNQQVNLILPVPGEERQFLLVIGWRGSNASGIETLRGATPGEGNPTHSKAVTLQNGTNYTALVEVRKSGTNAAVKAMVNGRQLFDWNGAVTDLNNPWWPTENKRMFGLGVGSGNGGDLKFRFTQFTVSPLGNGSASVGTMVAANSTPDSSNNSTPQPPTRTQTPPQNSTPNTLAPPTRSTPTPQPAPTTTVQSGGERWWQFRGSNYGHTSQTGLPIQWSERENVVWKAELPSRGASSPVVVGNRIFVTSYSGYGINKENPGDPNALARHLFCIDRNSGNIMWQKDVPAVRPSLDYKSYIQLHGYASHTPCSDGQRVFVHFGNSGVYAFNLSGNQLWHKDVGSGTTGNFGSAGSPVIINGMLIVNASIESERLIAFNPQNGNEIWTTRLGQSYTTPVLVQAAGRSEIIVPSGRDGRGIVGFDASNGQPLWEYKGFKSNRYICASPIFHNGIIYGTASVDGPLAAIRPGGNGDITSSHEVWRGPAFATDVTSPVFHNGRVFWIGGRSGIFDAQSGEQVGRARLSGGCWSTPLVSGNRLYVVSQNEGIYVLEADNDLTEVAKNQIREPGPQDNWNASLVPDQGRLLVRSPKALYCIGN